MATTNSLKGLLFSVVLLFVLLACFVIRRTAIEQGSLDYHDTARAKNEIDQSYAMLMISDAEQKSLDNELKDKDLDDTSVKNPR